MYLPLLFNSMWKTDKQFLTKDLNTFILYPDFNNYRSIKALIQEKFGLELTHVKKVSKHNLEFTQVIIVVRFTFKTGEKWCVVYDMIKQKNGDFFNEAQYFEE